MTETKQNPEAEKMLLRLIEISEAKKRGVDFYSMRFSCRNCGAQAVEQIEKGIPAHKRTCNSCGCFTMNPMGQWRDV